MKKYENAKSKVKKEITEKRISELEDSVTEDVKIAWDTLEEIIISNDITI